MKIVFFGSSDFAYPSLEALIKSKYELCAIVTQPDRPRGRHLKLESSKIKILANKNNILVCQPENLNTKDAIIFLTKLKADLFIVISYGKILSKEILTIPKIFSINVHASLLPKYRGAAPINWALINADVETGITIIQINEIMDAGSIILQEKIKILSEDNALTLNNKLSNLGANLLIKVLDLIEKNKFSLKEQNNKQISFAPKLKKEDGLINWAKTAEEIHNQIRGCFGWPGTFTHWQNKLLKIYKTEIDNTKLFFKNQNPGTVVDINKNGIFILTAKGILIIKELQLESSKKMDVNDFIIGHKIEIGDILV